MPISMPESVWALEGFWVEGGEAFSPFNETVELALLIKQWVKINHSSRFREKWRKVRGKGCPPLLSHSTAYFYRPFLAFLARPNSSFEQKWLFKKIIIITNINLKPKYIFLNIIGIQIINVIVFSYGIEIFFKLLSY